MIFAFLLKDPVRFTIYEVDLSGGLAARCPASNAIPRTEPKESQGAVLVKLKTYFSLVLPTRWFAPINYVCTEINETIDQN